MDSAASSLLDRNCTTYGMDEYAEIVRWIEVCKCNVMGNLARSLQANRYGVQPANDMLGMASWSCEARFISSSTAYTHIRIVSAFELQNV
jgi:hypothetical protein